MGTKEILQELAASRKVKEVDCSDIFGDESHVFYLRYLPMGLFERYQQQTLRQMADKQPNPRGLNIMVVSMALCEEDGTPVFDWKKQEDKEACGRIPAKMLSRLAKIAASMNVESEEQLKELAGNSEGGTIADSF